MLAEEHIEQNGIDGALWILTKIVRSSFDKMKHP
jgi:hypothetical protein